MRISSIGASMLTCLLLYSLVKKYYSANSAIVVTGVASVLFMFVYYSFASRGYALINLFFVLALYAVHKIIFENNRVQHWIYFLSSAPWDFM
jgi:4-amino-4-deoxy-L-arabinose transferase-like glycosyltransferase